MWCSMRAVLNFASLYIAMYQVLFPTRRIKWKQLQKEFPRPTFWLKVVDCCIEYIYTCSSLQRHTKKYKLLSPSNHLYMAVYFWFCAFNNRESLLHINCLFVCLFVWIDHYDGTITGILSHLNTRYEPYINRYLIYGYRLLYQLLLVACFFLTFQDYVTPSRCL